MFQPHRLPTQLPVPCPHAHLLRTKGLARTTAALVFLCVVLGWYPAPRYRAVGAWSGIQAVRMRDPSHRKTYLLGIELVGESAPSLPGGPSVLGALVFRNPVLGREKTPTMPSNPHHQAKGVHARGARPPHLRREWQVYPQSELCTDYLLSTFPSPAPFLLGSLF